MRTVFRSYREGRKTAVAANFACHTLRDLAETLRRRQSGNIRVPVGINKSRSKDQASAIQPDLCGTGRKFFFKSSNITIFADKTVYLPQRRGITCRQPYIFNKQRTCHNFPLKFEHGYKYSASIRKCQLFFEVISKVVKKMTKMLSGIHSALQHKFEDQVYLGTCNWSKKGLY